MGNRASLASFSEPSGTQQDQGQTFPGEETQNLPDTQSCPVSPKPLHCKLRGSLMETSPWGLTHTTDNQ